MKRSRCWRQSSGLVWWWADRQHRSGRDQRARTVAFLPPQAGRHDCGRGVAVGLDGCRLGDFTRSMFAPDIFDERLSPSTQERCRA